MMAGLLNLFKKQPKPKPLKMGDVGWSESYLYGGDFPKYNPDDLIGRKGAKIYRTMLLDEQVKAVVKFKRDAITSRDFIFMLDDDRLSEKEADNRIAIYESMIDSMAGSFNDGLNYVMSAMHSGFSLTEQHHDAFDYKGTPFIGLKKLTLKPFDTFEFRVDKYGNIEKCIQVLNVEKQTIDLRKFVYYVHNPEFDQHYGQSDLREAYRSWYSKDVVIRLYNQFLERFAGGFVVARPGDGMTLTQGTKEYNSILSAINNIRTQTSILFPAKMEMDVHQPSSTDQFEKAIAMHDNQISKALLVPNLLGITPQGNYGSYGQASTQLEAFLWTLDADALRLKDALNEQVFDVLSQLNFADGIGPRLEFKPVSESKKYEAIKTWQELVTASAVEATDTDEEHLRKMLDFPEKGEPIVDPMAMPAFGNPEVKEQEPEKQPKNKADMGESVLGVPSGPLAADVRFDRAEKRVPFAVMNRKFNALENDLTERTASLTLVLRIRAKAGRSSTRR
jgi:phage gp29-like protein